MIFKRSKPGERGAAAVEFALILPILLLLVLGLVEFSRVFNVQISLSNAAREGARVMAIENNPGLARSAATAAAPSVNPSVAEGDITVNNCTATITTVTMTIDYDVDLLTGFFGETLPLTGTGVMLCGG
ncbi:TadE/TadG family type IV pilus assembly protein [Cryobacterium lyxosi]|uniref:Pilus assembly protein n=1 Tax=Cryobacterium lyxosi TaxID=1259228 RepID=A0A4R8ZDJ4_9MICO|nr:TadE/TadG family type IV pilus assembly protein [Cryobacterium lyxosi]TFD25470.1 pilus assembly protein [Cryobacterium lyxosi]